MCKHEVQDLIGTSEGIKCRNCGKQFPDFASVLADAEDEKEVKKDGKTEEIGDTSKSENLGANPEDNGVHDKILENSKTEAVQPKGSTRKGLKASSKKAVSKK